MKRLIVICALIIGILPSSTLAMPSTGTVEAYFSPRGGVTEAIVHEIQNAKQEILVQAYGFTSKPIAKAILDAKKRGVGVIAILDKTQRKEKYTEATFLTNAGCMVLIDSAHAIAHNKIMIIDRSTLITGSFNFTKAAEEKNAENILITKGNKPLIDKYLLNFDEHKQHSERYQ
jgi:phosphatidylserine/phosphatidylglycerophosphate/cardiolipin synthase-like enzyme